MPFPDRSFDGLLSVHTVYFFTDRAAALREMRGARSSRAAA